MIRLIFVHASDIQLLEDAAIEQILEWQPQIVLAAGPPLYLTGVLTRQQCQQSLDNALRLARQVDTLILDHHLLRSLEGFDWLSLLSEQAGKRIYCAADFMRKPRLPLEALRFELYRELPTPAGWYEAYAQGQAEPEEFCDETLLAKLGSQSQRSVNQDPRIVFPELIRYVEMPELQ